MNYQDAKRKVFATAMRAEGYNGDNIKVSISRTRKLVTIVTPTGSYYAGLPECSTDREAFETVKADGHYWDVHPTPGHEHLAKPEPAGTEADPIRYARIDANDPDRSAKLKAQREKSDRDVHQGKVIDMSDLMISHGM